MIKKKRKKLTELEKLRRKNRQLVIQCQDQAESRQRMEVDITKLREALEHQRLALDNLLSRSTVVRRVMKLESDFKDLREVVAQYTLSFQQKIKGS